MKEAPTPEQIAEGDRRWAAATIADDYLFSQIGLYNEVVEQMLSIILGEEVGLIKEPYTQETINLDYDVRGIRLDVIAKSSNKVYNIEMQTTNEYNLFERERLYHGIIDINESFKGMDFIQLKESIVIFICTFDPVGRGKSAYIQQSYESNYVNYKSTGKLYNVPNGSKTIYLVAPNYKKEKNLEIRNFLSYIMGKKVKGDVFIDMLDNTVTDIKLNPVIKSDYVKRVFKEMDIESKIRKEEQAKAKADKQKALKEEQAKAKADKQKALKEEQAKAKADKQKALKEEQAKAKADKQKALEEEQAKALKEKKKMIKLMLSMSTPEEICKMSDIPISLIKEVQSEMEK